MLWMMRHVSDTADIHTVCPQNHHLCKTFAIISLPLQVHSRLAAALCAQDTEILFQQIRRHRIYRQKATRQLKNQCKFCINVPGDVQITCSHTQTTGRFSPLFQRANFLLVLDYLTWRNTLFYVIFCAINLLLPVMFSSSSTIAVVEASCHVRLLRQEIIYMIVCLFCHIFIQQNYASISTWKYPPSCANEFIFVKLQVA